MYERDFPFVLWDRPGRVTVRIERNVDPDELGHPLVALAYDRASFLGFPVVEAVVHYTGKGPRAQMGWLQLIERRDDDETVTVDIDVLSVLGDESPFYTFGYAPTFADAPANPHHPDGTWNACAFLVAIPDIMRSRTLALVNGFSWGYRLERRRPVEIFEPSSLPTDRWNGIAEVLASRYPKWSFLPSSS